MGKNKKSKQTKPKEQQSQTTSTQVEPTSNEPQLTPEEKAQQYKDMQLQVLNKFITDFQEEEKALKEEPNFQEKQKDLDKREKEEMKRLEKTLFKKDQQDIEELYANMGGAATSQEKLKLFRDRIAKSIAEISKQQKVLGKIEQASNEGDKVLQKIRDDISSCMNKKTMLENLCNALLQKNYELYLKHERMLEEEKAERSRLATTFQEQMNEVNKELEGTKAKRQAEVEENQEIRKKIQEAIAAYKQKEEGYRSKMESHSKVIMDIEKKLKSAIEGSITKTIKEAEAEKAKFVRSCENVKELSGKISGYMEKFDQIKDEINENGKKFEGYQAQVETKKLEIQTLEAEIEAMKLAEKKRVKVETEIEEERKRFKTQLDTLKNLKNALSMQLKSIA